MKKYILLILTISLLAFTFTGGPPGGWYQQILPNLGGRQITDMVFIDSLTGFMIASKNVNPDTSSILKTTNGGDNWQIILTQSSRRLSRVQFINSLTGFVSGGSGSGTPYLYKTTDGGKNWFTIAGATLGNAYWDDMSILNEDTMWLVDDNGLNGGVFRTTNGGINWTQQHLGSVESIYMYNYNLGFYGTASRIYRTTNGGNNWLQVYSTGFTDMIFADSLTGWCTRGLNYILKTTDGGITWLQKQLPQKGGIYLTSRIKEFALINKDTLYGVDAIGLTESGFRGLIYMTEDGGETWGYQLPDTSINIFQYLNIAATDKNHIWAFGSTKGIHTKVGGSTVVYTSVQQTGTEIPEKFELYQNYPNPFNPATSIKFKVQSQKNVKLSVFDAVGREIAILINGKLSPGEYKYPFNGSSLPSGVYFYQLKAEGFIDTKKMILIK